MNCPKCGNPLDKGAQFCPKCLERVEPPSLWQRFCSLFQAATKPHRSIIKVKKTVTIRTKDKDGNQREFHSLDEAPPEVREEIAKLEAEALKGPFQTTSSSDAGAKEFISRKTVSIFRVKDASGTERVYHSLEEMPPDVRAAIERARAKESG